MGIDLVGLEAILLAYKYVNNKESCLTLARQGIHINQSLVTHLLSKYKIFNSQNINYNNYCENLFHNLQFKTVDSIDTNCYENASIIHNMNDPIPKNLKKYDFIYDGGTIEHIYNIPQVMENIIDLLDINGIFCSVTCNNNFSGHGFYQFSPEFFYSSFSKKYGMEIIDIYITEINKEFETWKNVNINCVERNETRFFSTTPVYIVTIAKKISNTRLKLTTNSPQQQSYEKADWVK